MFSGNNQVPGSNLLNMAFRIIAKQSLQYYQAVDRTLNDVGQNVTEYAPPVAMVGSFQPVPRKEYEALGLDFQKQYFVFYTSNPIVDIQRDVSADQLVFQGTRYQCESNTAWYGIDGWVGVICIAVDVEQSSLVLGFNQNLTFPALLNSYQNFYNGNFAVSGGE